MNRILLCLLFLFTALLQAQVPFPYAEAVDAAVTAEMQKQQIVGVAVGVIRDSKVVYTKGYGLANLRSRTPVTDGTVFNWASNSKPVMAIAAMQLVKSGQLDLDKTIDAYLPTLPNTLKPITTRQLLCHQSGIPHYSNGKIVPSGRRIRPEDELDPFNSLHRFVKSPLIFEPGTKTDYSSYAYVLLSAVVQAAGKQPIAEQIKARIVAPLGLQSFQLDLPFKKQENWVTGYKLANGKPHETKEYANFWKHGAGGYKSHIKDFARFAAAVANMELIDETTTNIMWTNQKTRDGTLSSYGLGVQVEGSGPSLKISHNGSQDETATRMVIYPNQKHGIVVMSNTHGSNPGAISTAIYGAMRKN
jgi:CubicO group peptidase (beta-lactamase class C family)